MTRRTLFEKLGVRVSTLPLGKERSAVELTSAYGGDDTAVLEIDDVETLTAALQRWAALERQARASLRRGVA